MKPRFLGLALMVLGLVFIAAPSTSELHADRATKAITGVVKRFEVRGGKVRSVYIADPKQGDILVMRGNTKGKELLGRLGETVKATGYVRKPARAGEFKLMIDIREYEVVAPAVKVEKQ